MPKLNGSRHLEVDVDIDIEVDAEVPVRGTVFFPCLCFHPNKGRVNTAHSLSSWQRVIRESNMVLVISSPFRSCP